MALPDLFNDPVLFAALTVAVVAVLHNAPCRGPSIAGFTPSRFGSSPSSTSTLTCS